MTTFKVQGGNKLKGEIKPQGAKNEALQILCAVLLTDQEVIIENVPDIRDVNILINLLRDLEVEVDSLEQLSEVLAAGADLVLLDNFTPEQMAEAVSRNANQARLEASGGLTLDSAAAVAATGVDYIAVGAITHSAPILDIGADLVDPEGRS